MKKQNNKGYDFAGYVTKNDIQCSDGVTIKQDAFKDSHGKEVPLVWQHNYSSPDNVLGKLRLENRKDGVYGYGYFNNTETAKTAKQLVEHGDINSMSINANKIKKNGSDVIHGVIREVSLVLAGANPGALIEEYMMHDDSDELGAIIMTNEHLVHEEQKEEEEFMPKTIEEIFDGMTDEQLDAVSAVIDEINNEYEELLNEDYEEDQNDEDYEDYEEIEQGDYYMKNNIFETEEKEYTLSHSELNGMIEEAKINKTNLKDVFISHGISNIDYLFPEAKMTDGLQSLKDPNTATADIMSDIIKSPFGRIKTVVADLEGLSSAEAKLALRAKGYVKGNEKVDQVFELLKRETLPQTIYKKQKLDRDDLVDIEDGVDLVGFIKTEMKDFLMEELARAILVGDGRLVGADDKINPDKIRPVISDNSLYTIQTTSEEITGLVDSIILALGDYRGNGLPKMYANPRTIARLRLLKDTQGRYLHKTDAELTALLGVQKIVPTTFLEEDKVILTNLQNYKVGASKGGEVTTFEDFDIDFNQQKYLIETRCSGALFRPKSAIVVTIVPKESGV